MLGIDDKHKMVELGKPTSIWLPEEMLEVWQKFKKIAEREGRSAGQILIDFVANYVRIHEPGNPQWPLPRFFENSRKPTVPTPGKPMPDYWHMTDQELQALYKSPRTPFSDRIIIRSVLNKRKIKVEGLL